jgi:hypothetical protein
MKVTIFVTLSDNFFKIFEIFGSLFSTKSSKSLLIGHFYYLVSNLHVVPG